MREMKDSGIKWIGVIPSAWRTARVKNVAETMQSGGTPDSSNDTFYVDIEGGIPWVAIADMSTTPYVKDTNKHISEEGRKSKNLIVFEPGTILYAMYASVGKVSELAVPATINQALLAIVLNSSIDGSFFKYALNAWEPYIISESNGTTQFNLNANKVANLCFSMPNRLEQESIVRYLDTKCAQVDTLIANVQAQIEKLKAYKQSLITEVVTKGLDPTAPMKDSGVEWIGSIPTHWEKLRVKNIGDIQNGISKGGEYFGSGYPFVSYGDVYKNMELPRAVAGLVESTDADRANYSVKKGDIFFTRTSETIEEVGFSAVCTETIDDATFAGFLIRLRPFNDAMTTQYAKYYFRGEHIRRYLVKEMNLVTRASLGQGLLKAMTVLIPPHEEQIAIAEYLDDKRSHIDRLIAIKQAKIEKLEQYKRSLIYEYVTGKQEVV